MHFDNNCVRGSIGVFQCIRTPKIFVHLDGNCLWLCAIVCSYSGSVGAFECTLTAIDFEGVFEGVFECTLTLRIFMHLDTSCVRLCATTVFLCNCVAPRDCAFL